MEKDLLKREGIRIYSLTDFIHQSGDAYELLQKFKCMKAPSLQQYLLEDAIRDDSFHEVKTYIIFDEYARLVVSYFSIRTTCMLHKYIRTRENEKVVKNIIPCIEITKFCVNDLYREFLKIKGYKGNYIGKFVFEVFIVPVLVVLSEKVGFEAIVLFALKDPENKVVDAYRNHMGFESAEDDEAKIISSLENTMVIVDEYSSECQFLFLELQEILRRFEGGNTNA